MTGPLSSPNHFRRRLLILIAAAACIIVAATHSGKIGKIVPALENRHLGWRVHEALADRPSNFDRTVRDRFKATAADQAGFDLLFGYFLQGFVDHLSEDSSRVYYPGMPSNQGYSVNGLEGFARTAPLLGAWIHSGRSRFVTLPGGKRTVDLVALLRKGLIAGTDPAGPGYWGDIGDADQRIVETADIARLAWLTRKQIWDNLSPTERRQIATWLSQVNEARIGNPNNWLLFPVVVNAFLKSVGEPHVDQRSDYDSFKSNYLQNGWFRDGPHGHVDFYNSWGISYDLFWIVLIDPSFDRRFIRSALEQSGQLTAHLVSPAGLPIMGRSICYRTAVPSAVIAGSMVAPTGVPPGLAQRALAATWRHFVSRDILRQGTMTMGYYATDPRLVDRYSGGGSCHWGLRSLTLAYLAGPNDRFWTDTYIKLPVEDGDYDLVLPKLGWTISGRRSDQNITITIARNATRTGHAQQFSAWKQLLESATDRPRRPDNMQLKYELREYSVADPLGGALNDRR